MARFRGRRGYKEGNIWLTLYINIFISNNMTDQKPEDLECISDGELEEIKKKPEYKDASLPSDLWKTWLERRKTGATVVGQGAGGIGMEGEQASGDDKSINKPVETKTYIGKPNNNDQRNEQ